MVLSLASVASLLITKWEEEYEYKETSILKWDWSPLQNKDVSSKTELLSGEDERNMPSSLLNEDLIIT